jgi:hypothetical protein
MKKDPELQDVDTSTLIKFISANLPKDMSLNVTRPPDITYISNVPRPAVINGYVPIKVEDSKDTTLGLTSQVIDSVAVSNE